MGKRSDLNEIFKTIVQNVYFQPPQNVAMKYPCIVYKRAQALSEHANNEAYFFTNRYSVTVIDRNPDSKIVESLYKLPLCRHITFFVADNLNHDVFEIFF